MPRKWSPPRIGQRMIKTAVAVLICLLFYYLRGRRGEDMPTEAAITAIICMQPYVRDSREYALNRMTGTLIGAFWGLLFLFVTLLLPALGHNLCLLYVLMSLGVLLSLYTAVAFRKPDASGLAAIVFICIVIAFPDIEQPLLDALDRILGVLLGTAVAIGVNLARLPRSRNRKRIFFVRSDDLVPDRFAQISPSVLFHLNSLCQDGAKICLISRHAPAFFVSQVSAVTLNLPMIVMDGAALYDVKKSRYIRKETIREPDAAALMERLDRMGLSYFLYAIHRNRTCIFHKGELTEPERGVLNQLRSSPYRSYLDGELYAGNEIVYFKLIGPDSDIARLSKQLHTFLRGRRLRAAVQAQNGAPGVSGLYIYSERATVRKAEHHLMQLLEKTEANLCPEELFLPGGYRSEHDAMALLHRLYNRYAPIRFLRLRRGGGL
ncbi:MAG: FUSC family protein [Oscillibacter sp.]|nr:FUSC family protein [Oscillibacter sp.]